VVKTVEDLTLMKPYLIERVDSIETVLPTVTTPNDGDYAYISASSCKAAFRRALDDTIKEEIPIDKFLRYLRRIYIVSGLSSDDSGYGEDLKTIFDMAMYIKINEEEE
jgi:hypothetical protein